MAVQYQNQIHLEKSYIHQDANQFIMVSFLFSARFCDLILLITKFNYQDKRNMIFSPTGFHGISTPIGRSNGISVARTWYQRPKNQLRSHTKRRLRTSRETVKRNIFQGSYENQIYLQFLSTRVWFFHLSSFFVILNVKKGEKKIDWRQTVKLL